MRSPTPNIMAQSVYKTYCFLGRSVFGHRSTIPATKISISAIIDPNPNISNIKKNIVDHNGANGNWAKASGHTTNAKPAPEIKVIKLYNNNNNRNNNCIDKQNVMLPSVATLSIGMSSFLDMKPITQNTTKPA